MKAIKRILVPVDYSTTSGVAIEAALSLAQKFGAAIEVVHTWSEAGYVDASIGEEVNRLINQKAKDDMLGFLARFEAPPNVEITSRVQHGVPWQVITALSPAYDLIVMGTHGRTGFRRLFLGSVAARVVQHAECPVLTVREPGEEVPHARRRREQQIVHAIFDDKKHLEYAFEALQARDIGVEDISLVMTEETHDRDFKALDQTKALEGATAGSLMGGSIGGILGGLLGIGSIVTGGIGLVVMGPALAFAAAGGLFGGLLGRSVPSDRAMVLRAELTEGKTLLAVHVRNPERIGMVRDIILATKGELVEF